MAEIGNSLREARIRKGLTIKDVEDATKIRAKYLEALEEDDFEVMPGPVFAKAFLRTYAAFLKLDADGILEDYRRSHEVRREEPPVLRTEAVQQPRSRTTAERRKRRARRSQRGYALVGVLAVIAVVLLAFFYSTRGGDNPAPVDSASFTATATDQTTTSGAGSTTATSGTGGATSTSGTGGTTSTSGATSNTTRTSGESGTTQTSVAASSTTASTEELSGENVKLVLTVTEGSCWLVVKENDDKGPDVFAGTLSAGGQKTFDNSKRYWMNIGAPEVLSVSINGTLHAIKDPAGEFIITAAGIEPYKKTQ